MTLLRKSLSIILVTTLFVCTFDLLIFFGKDTSGTEIPGGHISTTTTWGVSGSPYIINGDVIVDSGITLEIEPGVEVKFNGKYNLYIEGDLTALGNDANHITFTSNSGNPSSGDWDSIRINSTGHLRMNYCDVLYGNYAIYIHQASDNLVENTTISQNLRYGIYSTYSSNTQIKNSNIGQNGFSGIYFYGSSNADIINCAINSNSFQGISISNSSEINIFDSDSFSNELNGIHILQSSYVTIINSDIYQNSNLGVTMRFSKNIIFENCEIFSNGEDGMYMLDCTFGGIKNCIFYDNENGIYMSNSSSITVENSQIYTNDQTGLTLLDSSYCTLENLDIYSTGDYGIYISWDDESKIGSSFIIVRDANISNNLYGIAVRFSHNTTVENSHIFSNDIAISAQQCEDINVISNNISTNKFYGISYVGTKNGVISENELYNNYYGIFLLGPSYDNLIHHNTVKGHTYYSYSSNSQNQWDDGAEGNYWGDYDGIDLDANGIGDEPYPIQINGVDRYPLVDFNNTIFKIMSSTPVNRSILVAVDTTVTFDLSESAIKGTFEGNITVEPFIPILSYDWQNSNKRLIITFTSDLLTGGFYSVTVKTNATGGSGRSLKNPFILVFYTENPSDTTPPQITGVFPTGFAVLTNTSAINITFSETMIREDAESAFSLYPEIPGEFSWDNNTLYFHPKWEFLDLTEYTVTINGNIAQDIVGYTLDGNANGLAEGSPTDDYSWSFTTTRYDITPPSILNVQPTGNMVDIDSPIKIYFSELMNKTSVEDAFSYTNGTITWTSADGSWGRSSYIMTFIPSSPFNYSQFYTVTLKGTAFDWHDNTLDGNANGAGEGSPIDDYTWTFKTIYDPEIGLPVVHEALPSGTDVDIDAEIEINFSQEMNQSSVLESFTITDGVTIWDKDDGSFIWEDNRTYFLPEFDLKYGTLYEVRINITAKNIFGEQLDGNENGDPDGYEDDAYSWTFETEAPAELIISYLSIDGEDALDQSKIWYADSGDLVLIGVNITNIGYFSSGISFNVSLYNLTGFGNPLNLTIAPLGQYQDSGTVLFSWRAPTLLGDHFVEIIVDWGNEILEVDEDNNSFVLHFAIGPDYVPANITVDGMDASNSSIIWYVDLGIPVEIGVVAKNTGFSGVSSNITYSIAIWNSTSEGDLIGSNPIQMIYGLPGLGAGESSVTQTAFWYVPNENRDFYIAIIIDYNETTTEIDEGNNVFVLHLAFSPDYAISEVRVDGNDANDPGISWNATANDPVTISANATNLGLSGVDDSLSYNISFFNSTPRGTPLGGPFYTTTLSGLLSGEDSGEIIGEWLPPNSAGDFYIVIIIDPDDALPEQNEENNKFVLHFTIGPDIVPNSVVVNGENVFRSPSHPIHVDLGENVTIKVNATNLGFSGTGSDFYLALYNGTRDGSFVKQPYFNVSVSALSSFGEPSDDSGSISAFWNAPLGYGLYYVVIYFDISDQCREIHENNNYWVLTFSISPDIVPNNITVDGQPLSSYPNGIPTLLPGQIIDIGANASNIGESGTGVVQFSIAYYNSTSTGENKEPQFAYWDLLGPLGSNGFTSDYYGLWQAPYSSESTDYYINISIDSENNVSEENEDNNYYILYIRVDAPDLTPDKIVIKPIGEEGAYLYEDPFAAGYVTEEIPLPLGTNINITFDVINLGGIGQILGTNVTFYNISSQGGPANATPFFQTLQDAVNLTGFGYLGDRTSDVGQTIYALWVNPGIIGLWYINITIDMGNRVTEFNDYNNTFTIILNITDYPVTTLLALGPSYFGPAIYVNSTSRLNLSVAGINPPFYTWYRIIDLSDGSEVEGWTNYTQKGANITLILAEGTYKIEYNSTDILGKNETTRSRIIIIDETPPQTDIDIGDPSHSTSPFDILNITSTTPICLYAKDLPFGESYYSPIQNASGVNLIYYKIVNVSTGNNVTGWIPIFSGIPYFLDDPLWGDGYYKILFYSTDNIGQQESVQNLTIYLDNIGPNLTLTAGDPKYPHTTYDWFVTSSTPFTLSIIEEMGSGVNLSKIEFKISYMDGGISSSWITGPSFDIASSFMQEDGNYTIKYRAWDHLSNMKSGFLIVYVDDTQPIIHLDIGDDKYKEFLSDYYNVTSATPMNITGDDGAGSGISSLEYRIFNASYDSGWISFSNDFNLSGLNSGLYLIEYRGVDNLGNSETKSLEVFLDNESPKTELILGEPRIKTGGGDIWNITSSTSITLNHLYDIGSGLAFMEYGISNSTFDTGWLTYSNEFYLTTALNDGYYFIKYRGIDNLGIIEEDKTEMVFLDNTGLDANLTIDSPAYREIQSDTWNVTNSTMFIKNDIDDLWGPFGDNPPFGWTIDDHGNPSSSVWDNNDWHRYYYSSSYPSGTNTYAARVYSFPLENQDEELITPSIDVSGYSSVILEYDTYYNDYTTATVDYGDVDVSFDGGSWTTVYTYSQSDNSGTKAHAITVPIGANTMQVRWRYRAYNEWYWFVDNVKITSGSDTLFFEDFDGKGSGIEKVMHRIYGNDSGFYYTGWLPTPSFSLNLSDGFYTIEYYGVDYLSNIGPVKYLTVYLDNTAPESYLSIGDPKYKRRQTDLWTVSEDTLFSLHGEDGKGSGVLDIYYSIWNDTNIQVVSSSPYSQPFNVSQLGGDGQYTIRFWSEDNLGNTENWKEETVILDSMSPTIKYTSPTGSGNSIDSPIQVIFSEVLNHDSVRYAFSITDGSQIWDFRHGFFNWNGNIMMFYPYESFPYEASLTVTINTSATDNVLNPLDGDGDGIYEGPSDIYTWNFETRSMPDTELPYIMSVYPEENAQNIGLNEIIVVEFSETMNEFSCEAAFTYSDGQRAFGFNDGFFTWTENTMTFIPNASFILDTQYTVTISTVARDILGNAIAGDFLWSFTTHGDITPPAVIASSPSGNNIMVDSTITVTFSEQMNVTSTKSAIVIVPFANGSFSWTENTLTFTPESYLEFGTNYFVFIGSEAKDISGNVLEFPFEFNFTTEPDTYPPEVIGHSPSGVGVDINSKITISFSEAMQHSSCEDAFSISPFIDGVFSWNGNNLIFTPQNLSTDTIYTITMGSSAKDLAGNSLQSPYQFSFETVIDPYPPYIIEVAPTGVDVSVDSVITVKFSEAMSINSLYLAFVIEPYVSGTIYFETDTLVFTPTDKFALNTTYNVTIMSTATDEAGNQLGVNYSWEFTTEIEEPSVTEPTSWDALLIWIFVVIAIVLLVVIYVIYKRRKKQEEETEKSLEEEEEEGEEEDLKEGEIEDFDEGKGDGETGGIKEGEGEEEEEGFECPACGTEFSEMVSECPECGAEFEGVDEEEEENEEGDESEESEGEEEDDDFTDDFVKVLEDEPE
ncbi:MAG: Ig-like domain-containing protein [Thermoplasmata archaeon]|nr:MAG: Ig-like domain-containing protein [Thermoplasmata archaeon]